MGVCRGVCFGGRSLGGVNLSIRTFQPIIELRLSIFIFGLSTLAVILVPLVTMLLGCPKSFFLSYFILFYGFMYEPFCRNRIKSIKHNSIK